MHMYQGVNAKLAQRSYCPCWFCFVLHAQPDSVGVSSLAVQRVLMFVLLMCAAVCIRYTVSMRYNVCIRFIVCIHRRPAEEDEEDYDEGAEPEEPQRRKGPKANAS